MSGITRNYPSTLRPALQIIGTEDGVDKVAGMFVMNTKKGTLFLADTTINIDPTAEELANIANLTAKTVRRFNLKPRIAMLSYSNFGSSQTTGAKKVMEATKLLKKENKNLLVDGEIQADFALNKEKRDYVFPFSDLKENANTLIFPNLESSTKIISIIFYRIISKIGMIQ